jgi:hypothetical protein
LKVADPNQASRRKVADPNRASPSKVTDSNQASPSKVTDPNRALRLKVADSNWAVPRRACPVAGSRRALRRALSRGSVKGVPRWSMSLPGVRLAR